MTGWNRVHIGCVCLAATVAAVLTACGSANPPLASPTTTAQSPSVAVAHTTTAPAPPSTSTAAPTGTSPVGTTRAPSSTTGAPASPAACHTGDFRAGAAYFSTRGSVPNISRAADQHRSRGLPNRGLAGCQFPRRERQRHRRRRPRRTCSPKANRARRLDGANHHHRVEPGRRRRLR